MQLADQYETYLDDLSRRMTMRFDGGGATKADLDRIVGRSTIAESAKTKRSASTAPTSRSSRA